MHVKEKSCGDFAHSPMKSAMETGGEDVENPVDVKETQDCAKPGKAFTNDSVKPSEASIMSDSEDVEPSDASLIIAEVPIPRALPSHGRMLPLGQFLVVYVCMSMGTLLGALDQTVVATILPQIASDFSAAAQISWVGTSFLLTSTAFQPIFGSLCDVFGRKSSFVISIGLFAVGTFLCGIAPNINFLISARAIAGLAAGGLMTTVHVIISDVVNLRHRGKYQGILQAVNGAGSSLGPLAGGMFVGSMSWRWAFYFQVPIAAVALVASVLCLPSTGTPTGTLAERFKKLDYIGMLLLVAGTAIFMTGITYGGSAYPWNHPLIVSLLVIGPVIILSFGYNETIAKLPIIPPYIFKNIAVDLIFCANFFFGVVFFSCLYYLPLYFQVIERYSALYSGLALIPLTVTCIFFSWCTGLLTSFIGNYKISLIVGYTLMLVASVLIFTMNSHTPRRLVFTYLLLLGCGMGCQLQNSLVAAQSAVSKKDVARTTAVRNFFRNFGGVFGLGISAAMVNSTVTGGINRILPHAIIDDAVSDQIISSPLDLRNVGLSDFHEDLALNVFIRALRMVFLIWIPASAICLVCACLIPPYDLDRGDEGAPKRLPFMAGFLPGRKTKTIAKQNSTEKSQA